jgi:putative chitinase
MAMVTLELLQKICPKTKKQVLESYIAPLNKVAQAHGILNNHKRVAAFLAQVAHESGGFNFRIENLNYNAKALQLIFKKYYPTEKDALFHERKPELIANKVYASRMGNGDEKSGDGWSYRGRGLIQLTGKENYTKFAESIKKPLTEAVAYLETVEGAVESAAWFWTRNNLNDLCDKDDFLTLTKKINGGTNGLEDRKHHYDIALKALKG